MQARAGQAGWFLEGAEAGITRGLGGRVLASLRASLDQLDQSPSALSIGLAWASRGQMAATVTIDKVYFETLLRRCVEWSPKLHGQPLANKWQS